MTALTLPGMPEPPPPPPDTPQRSAARRLTDRQARDIRKGRHPLTGGPLHAQADKTAHPGDPRGLLYRCGTCAHRILMRSYKSGKTYPKCDLCTITHSQASDVRTWWPACPRWEAT